MPNKLLVGLKSSKIKNGSRNREPLFNFTKEPCTFGLVRNRRNVGELRRERFASFAKLCRRVG